MPRPPSIAIVFKKTAEADWVRPLRQYIIKAFQEDPDAYTNDCQLLQRMRQDMRGASADETGRDLIFRYYSHLETLEPRFRVNEQGVKVNFRWTDAFTGDSTQQHSLAFEKAGVLFNLAVAFAMHGASLYADSQSSEAELTTVHMAGIYFQVAADRFHYINENFLHAPSLDLQQETINVLNGIMMAQAQECALIKSRLEKKKDATLSKLAQQASLMYSNVFDNLKAIIDTNQLPKGWLLLVETKLRYYQAMAQYHEARFDESKTRYGMSVARLSLAEQHAREATKLVGQFTETFFSTTNLAEDLYPESIQGFQELITSLASKINEELTRATHDNDVIYSDPVPNTSTIPSLEAASVVSNFDINKFYASEERSNVVGSELFSRLVPMAVHESSSLYSEEKAKMLRVEEDKINLADGELQDALSFMKIPGSLRRFERPFSLSGATALYGSPSFPPEFSEPGKVVRDAISDVQDRERSTPLAEIKATIDSHRVRATDDLIGISRMLDDEQNASELALREYASEPLFAGYQPSSRAASYYREQVSDNQKKLEDASTLDSSILKDYQTVVSPWLPTLQNGIEGITSVLIERIKEVNFEEVTNAQATEGESLVDIGQDQPIGLSGHVKIIQDIYEQLRDLTKIRRNVMNELKAATQNDDISSALVKANSGKDLQPLFARELKKYDPYTQRLQATTAKQVQLIKQISEEFRRLMELPQARAINDKWEQAESKKSTVESQVLEASQVYSHVRDGLEKAKRFYTMLSESLLQFHRQVKDFVTSRAAQREQLSQQIIQDSASRNQAMLKERLNQYAAPLSDQQQSPRSSYYQPPMQAPPQQNPLSQSPQSQGATHTFDVGQLANQAAQLSLSSPSGNNYAAQNLHAPQQQHQPMYSPGASGSAQYQPSAPPYQAVQQQPLMQQQQQQQPHHHPTPPGPPMQQQHPGYNASNQGYPYQSQPQQQQQILGSSPSTFQLSSAAVPQPVNMLGAPNDSSVDPYSATVRRSMAMESMPMTSVANPGYRPGYGGVSTYTSASVPAHGYSPVVSNIQPPYMQQSQPPSQHPAYGGYSEALTQNASGPLIHPPTTQPMGNAYPPHAGYRQQSPLSQPPASYGSTAPSNHPHQQQAYQGSQSFQQPQKSMLNQQPGNGGSQGPASGPPGPQQYMQPPPPQRQPASAVSMLPPQPQPQPAPYQPYSSTDGYGGSAPLHSPSGIGPYTTYGNPTAQGPGAPIQQGYYQHPPPPQQQQQYGQPPPPHQQHGNQAITTAPQGLSGAPPPIGTQYQQQPIQPRYGQQITSGPPPLNDMAYSGHSYSSQPPPAQQNAPLPPPAHVPTSQQGYGLTMGYPPQGPPQQSMQHMPPMQQQQQQQQGYQHGYGGNVGSLMD
ncbi:bck1-like resistance to osmotic shock [Coemansia sp. RSA 1813]|nr:bck1-like resistance to osmotic shock [Coemansia sp. RSA 1843]KAJ2213387.1 bck1-like resistance to osmotic shock [Coemansia sp. RSA 487]KAJ2572751.1 bck1-like resistance to osmotic shock [Coemansia sp. RSA 1813]